MAPSAVRSLSLRLAFSYWLYRCATVTIADVAVHCHCSRYVTVTADVTCQKIYTGYQVLVFGRSIYHLRPSSSCSLLVMVATQIRGHTVLVGVFLSPSRYGTCLSCILPREGFSTYSTSLVDSRRLAYMLKSHDKMPRTRKSSRTTLHVCSSLHAGSVWTQVFTIIGTTYNHAPFPRKTASTFPEQLSWNQTFSIPGIIYSRKKTRQLCVTPRSRVNT